MAVQQNHKSRSRRDMRRSHDALASNAVVECPKCGEMMRPHHVCPSCGTYRKKEVLVKA